MLLDRFDVEQHQARQRHLEMDVALGIEGERPAIASERIPVVSLRFGEPAGQSMGMRRFEGVGRGRPSRRLFRDFVGAGIAREADRLRPERKEAPRIPGGGLDEFAHPAQVAGLSGEFDLLGSHLRMVAEGFARAFEQGARLVRVRPVGVRARRDEERLQAPGMRSHRMAAKGGSGVEILHEDSLLDGLEQRRQAVGVALARQTEKSHGFLGPAERARLDSHFHEGLGVLRMALPDRFESQERGLAVAFAAQQVAALNQRGQIARLPVENRLQLARRLVEIASVAPFGREFEPCGDVEGIERDRDLETGERGGAIATPPREISQAKLGLGRIGAAVAQGAERRFGVIEPEQVDEQTAEPEPRAEVTGRLAQQRPERGFRFGEPPEFAQGLADLGAGADMARIDRQDPLETFQRFGEFAALAQHVAEPGERADVIRRLAQQRPERRFRFGEAAEFAQGMTDLGAGADVARIDRQDPLETFQRFGEFAALAQHMAEPGERADVTGRLPQQRPERGFRFSETAAFAQMLGKTKGRRMG
ncbi:MAG: hypothetical protein ABR970_10965 [Roseiarcus sp.]